MNKAFQTELTKSIEAAKRMKEEDKLYCYNGLLYPTIMCSPENLKALETFEAREDDVMLAAYPKCGFNWMIRVLHKIVAAATGRTDENPNDHPKFPPMLEFLDPAKQKTLAVAPSPRVVGTHMPPQNFPKSFFEKKTKPQVLVVFRNPKDTAVSFFHFTNGNPVLPTAESWDKFFLDFISGEVPWGSYFDHALAWEEHMDNPNVMVVTYEYLKENLSEAVQQIASFFNCSLSEEQIQTITQESTFKAMRENSKNSHGPMSNVFFRKGEVGDWKNHFSEAQSQEMDAKFEQFLAGTKLGARLQYDVYCK
ncbi:ST6B1 Sulfotransferase, partial [Atractosteus spatula]|nr:ST6B1 Sulfotransferase [Atractosteus spatula]